MKANWKHIAILWGIIALPAMIPSMLADPARLLNDWRFYIQALVIGIPQALLVVLIMRLSTAAAAARAATLTSTLAITGSDAITGTHAATDRFGLGPPRPIGRSLIIAVLGALLALISAAVLRLLLEALTPQVVQPAWQLTNRALLALALPAMIAIAYREELFFRAYLQTQLQALGLAPASRIAVAGLLFGLAHIAQGFAGIVVATAIGLLFGILFERYRNVHIVAIAHALYNMVVLVAATTVQIAL